MKIMLVQKHASLARLYREELEDAGFRVRVRPDMASAVAALERQPAQIVIMDAAVQGHQMERCLASLRKVHPGPVLALGSAVHNPLCGLGFHGVQMVPISSDLRPLLCSIKGQAAAMLWNAAAHA